MKRHRQSGLRARSSVPFHWQNAHILFTVMNKVKDRPRHSRDTETVFIVLVQRNQWQLSLLFTSPLIIIACQEFRSQNHCRVHCVIASVKIMQSLTAAMLTTALVVSGRKKQSLQAMIHKERHRSQVMECLGHYVLFGCGLANYLPNQIVNNPNNYIPDHCLAAKPRSLRRRCDMFW